MQVEPHETLFVTSRKRFVPVYVPGPDGAQELILYHGLQEVSFDEPELFPWAEKLIEQDSFLAGHAVAWSSEPLEWTRVRELLDSLLEAGLLDRRPPPKRPEVSALHLEFLEAEKVRRAPPKPLFWTGSGVMREITGRELPLGYLEAVVPVHRVAHAAVDREGRQVGESNSFPEALRLKIPTEWKSCGYSGSRYRDDLPMNMTALKSMIAHWKPVLRATLAFREEFLRRYPQSLDGRWKLGDLHLFTSGILALPAIQLVRGVAPVRNGELDPVLSSLFRVTDGVRMVCAQMLDLYERPMPHDHLVSARDITQGAERENQYISDRGVCAGPQNMIDEFVATLMNGKPASEPCSAGESWAADIPVALDYALRGRQLHALSSTLWVRMSEIYPRLREVASGPLREAIARDLELIAPTRLDLPEQRDWSVRFYGEIFRNAQRGLGEPLQELELTPSGALNEAALGELLQPPLTALIASFLRVERTALRLVGEVQRQVNLLLRRPHPEQPLTGNQLAILHLLRKGQSGGLPYLLDTISETLGVSFENTENGTTAFYEGRPAALSLL